MLNLAQFWYHWLPCRACDEEPFQEHDVNTPLSSASKELALGLAHHWQMNFQMG
jgi:hypothetical protein